MRRIIDPKKKESGGYAADMLLLLWLLSDRFKSEMDGAAGAFICSDGAPPIDSKRLSGSAVEREGVGGEDY